MRLHLHRDPAPTPPVHHWRPFASPEVATPAAERRPLLARFRSAPAHLQVEESTDYFSFPRLHHRPLPLYRRLGSAVSEHVREAEEDAEAGCFRLLVRAVRWWAWRKWRAHHHG